MTSVYRKIIYMELIFGSFIIHCGSLFLLEVLEQYSLLLEITLSLRTLDHIIFIIHKMV